MAKKKIRKSKDAATVPPLELSDDQWKRVSASLEGSGGYRSDKDCFEAYIYILWHNKPIRNIEGLPLNHPPAHSTLVSRLQLWVDAGVLPGMVRAYLESLSEREQKDWGTRIATPRHEWLTIFRDEIRSVKKSKRSK